MDERRGGGGEGSRRRGRVGASPSLFFFLASRRCSPPGQGATASRPFSRPRQARPRLLLLGRVPRTARPQASERKEKQSSSPSACVRVGGGGRGGALHTRACTARPGGGAPTRRPGHPPRRVGRATGFVSGHSRKGGGTPGARACHPAPEKQQACASPAPSRSSLLLPLTNLFVVIVGHRPVAHRGRHGWEDRDAVTQQAHRRRRRAGSEWAQRRGHTHTRAHTKRLDCVFCLFGRPRCLGQHPGPGL